MQAATEKRNGDPMSRPDGDLRLAADEVRDEAHLLPHAAQIRRGFRWLRFEAPLEEEFRSYYWRLYLTRTRWVLLIGALIFGVFAAKDVQALPADVWPWTVGIRMLLIVPAILLIDLLSFVRALKPYLEGIMATGVFIAMGGLSAVIVLSAEMGAPLPYEGLMLVIVFTFFLTGLRFYKASFCTLAAATMFSAASLALGISEEITLRLYYLYGVTFICMVGSYSIELLMRANFLTENVAQFRALRDPLTLLYNRRAAMDHLARAWRLAFREREPLAVVLIDVDHFKRYNDRYGHLAGDGCLSEVALTLSDRFRRPMDIVARYGGEEFLAVIYGVHPPTLRIMCEDLRQAVLDLAIPHDAAPLQGRVTVSIGAAWTEPAEGEATIESVIDAADGALYAAKRGGRNRCEITDAQRTPATTATAG